MRRWAGCVTLVALAWVLSGCFSAGPVSELAAEEDGGRLGEFVVTAPGRGEVGIVPTACSAGDRQFFLGADFTDPATGLGVRLVIDPLEGPAARVFVGDGGDDQVFRREDCSVFHFSFDSTGWRINDVYDYRVTLELDCARDGEAIRGSASATHCH